VFFFGPNIDPCLLRDVDFLRFLLLDVRHMAVLDLDGRRGNQSIP
jgi:hypothetical protein